MTTVAGKISLNTKQDIFDEKRENQLEFYVHEFSKNYDGLIGYDNLEKLNAVIDLGQQTVRLNKSIYKFGDEKLEEYNNLIKNFNINKLEEEQNYNKFKADDLNNEEKTQLEKLLNKYKSLFHSDSDKLTFTNAIKHKIATKHENPIYAKSYRYPQVHKAEVNKQIKEMLEQNIIRHSQSPYSAPLWVVPKKMDASGETKWRIVIDYRKLNDITIEDRFPIPNMDEILDKLGRCLYFSTLDLAKGFYQVEIDEASAAKTAFSTQDGHYEFLRMPMGLKNAPATFQRLMNSVLGDLVGTHCLVYLDDIIVFSTSLQEHMISLDKVLERLKGANLRLQKHKCNFMKAEVEFLGHIVTPDGIKPNPEKIEALKNFPIPRNEKQIKQFLGLAGFYRKFIRDFAKICKPLTTCLKKGRKVNCHDSE